MGAKEGNQNARKKGGPRVPVCLSISDERKEWAIRQKNATGTLTGRFFCAHFPPLIALTSSVMTYFHKISVMQPDTRGATWAYLRDIATRQIGMSYHDPARNELAGSASTAGPNTERCVSEKHIIENIVLHSQPAM
jgi:hypothetical protein